jgi:two-component system sensor histidine kinase/response regulator
MMPGLDGYGVIAALRADAETVTIPFIFLTAKVEKIDIRAGMNLGADDYLTKPVAKADLLAGSTRVSNALSSKQCRSSNLTSVLPYRWRKCSA